MDLINTENIFAWGTLIAYFTHGIITGWSYSLCFKVKVTKPVYMAIMIMATAVILVPSVFFNFYAPIKSIVLFFVVFLVLKLLSESNFVKSFIFCCFDMLINVGLELLLLGLLNLLGMNDFYDVSEFYTFSRMVMLLRRPHWLQPPACAARFQASWRHSLPRIRFHAALHLCAERMGRIVVRWNGFRRMIR